MGLPRWSVHHWMLCTNKRARRPAVPCGRRCGASYQARQRSRLRDGTLLSAPRYGASPVRDVASAVSSPPRAGENHCERHSHQACASQAFDCQAFDRQASGFQISADKTLARRTPASQRAGRHAGPRQQKRIAAGHPPHRSGGHRPRRPADHLHHCRTLSGQGVLSADHDGLHRRHHAVAGRELPRALPHSARGRRRADRGGGRRRRRLHDRPDRLARRWNGAASFRSWGRC